MGWPVCISRVLAPSLIQHDAQALHAGAKAQMPPAPNCNCLVSVAARRRLVEGFCETLRDKRRWVRRCVRPGRSSGVIKCKQIS
eukprot:5982218-Pleurochrysis_carterae.AAC.3